MGMDVDDNSDSNSLDATKEGDKNDTTNIVEAEDSTVEDDAVLGADVQCKGKVYTI